MFTIIPDEFDFVLGMWEQDKKSQRFFKRRVDLEVLYYAVQVMTDEPSEYPFFIASMILLEGETSQRKLFKRITDLKSRNISYKPLIANTFLKRQKKLILLGIEAEAKALYESDFFAQSNMIKENSQHIKVLMNFMSRDKNYNDVRKTLKLPEKLEHIESYFITDEMISSVDDQSCKNYLETRATKDYIFYPDFLKICDKLITDYAKYAKSLIELFKSTKSFRHLAIFSITTEQDQTFVNIANETGNFIKMEDWKFLKLLEKGGEPLRLHQFRQDRYRTDNSFFEFGNNSKGIVSGFFDNENVLLKVVCSNENSKEIDDNAIFIFDPNYLINLYIVLKRLFEDKELFKKYKMEADVQAADQDLFDKFKDSIYL